ncbi:MAG: hypothetical protein HQL45_14285 [Alphaproteobacteria bacterium]|nr:hypothetical protein [Alphaproteobacteria bacterium]
MKYIVQGSDLHHNGRHFSEGTTLNTGKAVDIDDDAAEPLVAKGRLVAVAEEAAPSKGGAKK